MKVAQVVMVGWALATWRGLLAEDAFYHVPLAALELTDGQLPNEAGDAAARSWRRRAWFEALRPYAVLDGGGEAYFDHDGFQWGSPRPLPYQNPALVLRAPKGKDAAGSLFLPKADGNGMVRVRFRVSASRTSDDSLALFYRGKERHYERLLSQRNPGGAWFRRQVSEARRARGEAGAAPAGDPWPGGRAGNLEDTYAIFTGGRALSENLQLDRVLPPARPGEAASAGAVDIGSLPGIDVAAMDWESLTRDLKPEVDPLAAFIPADQHALFFSSFQNMVSLMDEADAHGTPILELLEPRAEDARTRERYERQLCLSVSALSRLLGPQVIRSVAFTGSDPYLRTGTDVAVLFEAKQAGILREYILGQQQAAARADPAVKTERLDASGLSVHAAVSPGRRISSYMAVLGEVVAVANSLHQLHQVAAAQAGKTPSLASLKEYVFFRDRYRRGDAEEAALLVLTDATIRRWCGPRWRIATSRRTLAAAVLADLQAQFLDRLVRGDVEAGPIHAPQATLHLGELRLSPGGVSSSTFGTLEFLTPIAEMPLEKVTATEASVYRQWRDTYQRNWRRWFDPIAVRFTVRPERIGADVTVMPLIEGTEYRELIGTAGNARIAPDTGDRHAGSLLHLALAIDVDAETVKRFAGFANGWTGMVASPLSWLGQSVSAYVDQDPFWDEVKAATDEGRSERREAAEKFLQKNWHRLPVAVRAEATDALKLAAFIAGLRAFIEQSAPGMTLWEALDHQGSPYVKVSPTENARSEEAHLEKLAIYYAAAPRFLLVTLNEGVLKRALERAASKPRADPPRRAAHALEKAAGPAVRPWIGESLCLQAGRGILDFALALGEADYRSVLQARAWANLPVLNEWKRRYPDRDPVEVHETYWQTRLVSPGGGGYTWNAAWQTMESTAYGHPGEPRGGRVWPTVLAGIRSGNFGLTFEKGGLRARAELERQKP